MGQYWKPVNLDKRETIHPHKLGAGLKLREQLDSHIGSALVILCAAMTERRGGGDFVWDSEIAKRTIGRWAGDRIALVGDYSEDGDMPAVPGFGSLYGDESFADITDDVCAVIEHECGGKFQGDGWRNFVAQ